VPAEAGAASVANWLAHRHRLTRREAHRQVRLAKGLETHDLTRSALAGGHLNVEQAEAILRGLGTLPEDLDTDLKDKAEQHLLGLAEDFDAKALTNLSRRLLEVIAPEVADEHEAKLLEREERDAAAAARLSIWEDGHGKVHGRFTLDTLTGAMLKKALFAALARKLACRAGIIPAVLGGQSEVLDLGRKRRFHSKAQRILATIEQGGCLEEGCDAPPAMTQMHHPKAWSHGGETNRDGWMLCPSAHRRAHDPAYIHEKLPNGKIRFHRRT
jgi:hypothetical protein